VLLERIWYLYCSSLFSI